MEELLTSHEDITHHLLSLCDVYDLASLYSVNVCCTRLLSDKEMIKMLSSIHSVKSDCLSFPSLLFAWVTQHHTLSSPLTREELVEQAMTLDDSEMFGKLIKWDVTHSSLFIMELMFRGCHNILRGRVWGYDDMIIDPVATVAKINTPPEDPRFNHWWARIATYRLFFSNLLPPECDITNVDCQSHISVCRVEKLLLEGTGAKRVMEVLDGANIHQMRRVFHHDCVDVLDLTDPYCCWSSCFCYYSPKTAKWCLDHGVISLRYFYHGLMESLDITNLVVNPGTTDIAVGVLELVERLLTPSNMWNLANHAAEKNNAPVLEWLLVRMKDTYHNTYQGKLLTVRRVFHKYKVIDKEPLRMINVMGGCSQQVDEVVEEGLCCIC